MAQILMSSSPVFTLECLVALEQWCAMQSAAGRKNKPTRSIRDRQRKEIESQLPQPRRTQF